MSAQEITHRIQTAIPDAVVTLHDLAGDDDHWQVTVTSASFEGLSRVRQHQRVYQAIGQEMGTTLHALSVTTQTPAQYASPTEAGRTEAGT